MLRASLVKIIPFLGLCHADFLYSSMRIIQRVLCDWCHSGLSACVSQNILVAKINALCCEYMLHASVQRESLVVAAEV